MSGDTETAEPLVRVRAPTGEESSVTLEQFERLVRKGTVTPATEVCFPLVTGDGFVKASDLEIFRGLYSKERIVFQEQFNLARFPVVTALLVTLMAAVYLLLLFEESLYGEEAALVLGAKAAPLIEEAGQVWRILTFSFVHADKLHLLANVGFLAILGLALENAYSRRSFLIIVVSSALASGVSSYFLTEAPSVGASGIVFGILGGLIVFGVKYRSLIPRRYAYYFGWSVLPLLLITIYAGLTQPLVDHFGHGGGFVGGVAACLVLRAELLEPKRLGRLVWLKTGGALAALVAALFALGPAVARLAVETTVFEDDLGLRVSHPDGWDTREYDDLGYVVLRHEAYPYVLLTVGSIERDTHVEPSAALDRRLAAELDEAVAGGEVEDVRTLGRRELEMGGHRAAMAAQVYRSHGRRYYRELYVVTRGRLEHVVSLRTLAVWRRDYAPIFRQVVASVSLGEPRIRGGAVARRR